LKIVSNIYMLLSAVNVVTKLGLEERVFGVRFRRGKEIFLSIIPRLNLDLISLLHFGYLRPFPWW
jgi:uncharacterized secreted protein with C-terminal beta-propeller domain